VGLDEARSSVEVRVLGPIELRRDGRTVGLTSAKEGVLLAALAQRANHVLSLGAAIDALWGEQPPISAKGLVHNYISRLRKACGPHNPVQSVPSGYRLVLGPDDLDAAVFERLVGEGRRQRAGGEAEAAIELLEQALGLWRGAALGELAAEVSMRGYAQRLEELRLHAIEERGEAMLALGRHGELVAELHDLVAEHPLREQFWSQLMRGLYSAGRQAEALRAYQQFRRHLAAELGLEPSPGLVRLERDIACGSLALPAPTTPLRSETVVDVRALLAVDPVTFGRDDELASLGELLDVERFVTVVGPAGVGKTHLAMGLIEGFDSGVAVVPLSPVSDLNGALAVLAHSLDLRSTSGDLLEDCLRLLQHGARLLVIDNCEHVLDAARDLVAALLAGCPRLRVLTTSRERLGLPVEHVFRLAPLPVPSAEGANAVVDVSSVSLFVDRARRVRPDFAPGAGQLATIGDIVRHLDGLPLAIELAAGRLAMLGVDDLAVRIDRALDLLEGGRPAGEDRHRTLRAAIEWSYQLLDQAERRLFRHLSVFPDGFDLMTAEHLAADVAPEVNPIRALGHLVDASMLTVVPQEKTRYRMLDTLRHFGLDRLESGGELGAAQSRFTTWALDCATWIAERFDSADEPLADQRLRAELGNLQAAWRMMVATGDLDSATDLLEELYLGAQLRELIGITSLAAELLVHLEASVHPKRAVAYVAVALNAIDGLDFTRAQNLLDVTSTLALHDRTLALRGYVQAVLCMFRGEAADAERLMRGIDPHFVPLGPPGAALTATYRGHLDRAADLNHAYPLTSPSVTAWHHYVNGEIAGRRRDWATAASHYRDAIDQARDAGVSFVAAVATVGWLSAQVATGHYREATAGYLDLLEHYERTGGWKYQWTTLQNIADMLDRLDKRDVAAFLRDATSQPPSHARTGDPRRRQRVIAEARRALEILDANWPESLDEPTPVQTATTSRPS
jgi:predicted ATPase/DNA-binding SARP family transcriptional activator